MTSRAAISALLTILVLAPNSVRAESVVRLSMGDRVRVLARSIDPKPMVGRIVYADPLQMTIALDGADSTATRGVAWESLNSLERNNGSGSKAKTGLIAGSFVGLVGSIAGFAISDPPSNGYSGIAVFGGMLLGTAAGAAVGAGIGSLFHAEHWESLPLNSRVGLRLGAPATPFALGLRASF